jgi:hypothetical protein
MDFFVAYEGLIASSDSTLQIWVVSDLHILGVRQSLWGVQVTGQRHVACQTHDALSRGCSQEAGQGVGGDNLI